MSCYVNMNIRIAQPFWVEIGKYNIFLHCSLFLYQCRIQFLVGLFIIIAYSALSQISVYFFAQHYIIILIIFNARLASDLAQSPGSRGTILVCLCKRDDENYYIDLSLVLTCTELLVNKICGYDNAWKKYKFPEGFLVGFF